MITLYAVLILAILSRAAEPFKLGLKQQSPAAQQEPQPDQQQYNGYEYYPQRDAASYGYQQQNYLAERPLPFYPSYQPPALAYVIVRPIAPTYYPRYMAPIRPEPPGPVYGPVVQQAPIDSGVKGGVDSGRVQQQQEPLEASKGVATRPETYEAQPQQVEQQPLQQSEHVIDLGLGKLLKIKSSIDKFAAGAKSKLNLGTSYHVASEEYYQQQQRQPPAQPQVQQEEQQKVDIPQQIKEEQEPLREQDRPAFEPQQQLAQQERYNEKAKGQQETLKEEQQQQQQGSLKAERDNKLSYNNGQQLSVSSSHNGVNGQVDPDGFGSRRQSSI